MVADPAAVENSAGAGNTAGEPNGDRSELDSTDGTTNNPDDANPESPPQQQEPPTKVPVDVLPSGDAPAELVRISQKDAVWLDKQSKTVIVAGSICSREGPLEMFACPRGTKDYESVVAVDSRAQIVHTALLAAGIKSGTPVEFAPEYKAATGPIVEITTVWTDPETEKTKRVRAQQLVRNAKTREAMESEWVFAGSGFWADPESGEEFYLAEGGELVCVSNFATATLDLPVSSPQTNDHLFFEAFKENIPPLGTRVWLLFNVKTVTKPGS